MTSTEVPEVKHVTIPEPPPLQGDKPKPLARRFWQSIKDTVTEAREYADVIYRYRVAKANETELLRTGDTPQVIAYRKAKALHDENVQQIKADCEAQCKPFYDQRDNLIKEQDGILTDAENKARAEVNADSGVTAEDLSQALEEYKASAEIVRDWVVKLNKQVAQPYVYQMPSLDGKRQPGERGFTPRFSSITVNDKALTDDGGEALTKLTDLSEYVASQVGKPVNREFVRDTMLSQSLGNDRGVWDALEPESAVNFTLDFTDEDKPENNRTFHITVTKAPPPVRKDAKDTGDNSEAPDDDTSDDDE